MKTINKARLIIMIIVSIIFLGLTNAQSKADYAYANFSFDGNNLFGVIDNPRTDKEVLGLDWDLEIGAREKNYGVYIFYGQFLEQDYKNYGAGVDFYVCPRVRRLDLSIGAYYSQIIRGRASFTAWASPRSTIRYWFTPNLALDLTVKGQHRPELQDIVFELAGGLTFKLNRNRNESQRTQR